jgi:hypothetical protein
LAQPATPAVRETSLTLQQVVSRQEAHYRTIKTAQGTLVWQEKSSGNVGTSDVPPVRYIYFAREGERSVTLVLPAEEAANYAAQQSHLNWKNVLSGSLVAEDSVAMINRATTDTVPEVRVVPFNPAVHENNPLVAFHPRMVGDETVPLRELAAASVKMPTKPRLFEFTQGGHLMIRIDFINANTPDELLYYIVDTARGYIPVEIGRTSKGRYLSRSTIVIGQTPDKTWIPAKRTTVRFNANGGVAGQEDWFYEYLSVNEKLPPHTISLLFFKLPDGTRVQQLAASKPTARPNATPAATAAASPAGTQTRGARRYY